MFKEHDEHHEEEVVEESKNEILAKDLSMNF